MKQIKDYMKDNEFDIDKVIDDFSPYVKKIISNMVGENLSNEDKEEIVADTFFILWKNRLNNILSLDWYISGIVRNLVKEKLRKSVLTYNILDYENNLSSENQDTLIERRLKISELNAKLNKLNSIDKKIFIEFYYYSKSIKQISKILNISEGNVKIRLHRIKKKLKEKIEEI